MSDGSDPTHLGSGGTGQYLDVSVGMRAPSGQPLLLRTRQPYEVTWLTSREIWLTLLPSLILALALLYLVKAAFAYRLARDLYVVQEEREQLLVTALGGRGPGTHPDRLRPARRRGPRASRVRVTP